jgi:hypothetical protein
VAENWAGLLDRIATPFEAVTLRSFSVADRRGNNNQASCWWHAHPDTPAFTLWSETWIRSKSSVAAVNRLLRIIEGGEAPVWAASRS